MNAADGLRRIEDRAAAFGRVRILLTIGAATLAIAFFGHLVDVSRASEADGAIRVLEQQTAAAQRERHAATLAAIAAKQALAKARAHADSLEAAARAAKAESDKMAQLVRIASETTLVAQITPDSTIRVTVPRVVTQYIHALYATIQKQDRALAARDTQAVKADTVIVHQDRIVKADTVVIDSQAKTVDAEKSARPRFGFKTGLAAGATIVLVILHFAR